MWDFTPAYTLPTTLGSVIEVDRSDERCGGVSEKVKYVLARRGSADGDKWMVPNGLGVPRDGWFEERLQAGRVQTLYEAPE